MGVKINLLDTPGYLDFTGETLSAVRVADAAVIVVSAASGVEVGTERVWEYCEARGIPRVFFISMMDKEHAGFDRAFRQIKELSGHALPVEIPIGAGADFSGIVNLFSGKAHVYGQGTVKGEYDEVDAPAELVGRQEAWTTELQETLATTDEALLEAYLENGRIPRDDAIKATAAGMAEKEVFPVLCGSAPQTYGMRALLKRIVELCPSPADAPAEMVEDREIRADDAGPLAALVFKTATEPHIGELSYFRIFSGSVANGTDVVNASDGQSERLAHLGIPMGKDRLEVTKLHAGDIGVVAKLKHTHTNDTLNRKGEAIPLERIGFPEADISIAIRGATRADDDKLGEVIPKIREEDPTFSAAFDSELHQTIARGVGELHLDVQFERMERKYGVKIETEQPKIAYRETVARMARRAGPAQKAVRWPRTVRRLPGPHKTAAARVGLRVHRFDQGRRDPVEVPAIG